MYLKSSGGNWNLHLHVPGRKLHVKRDDMREKRIKDGPEGRWCRCSSRADACMNEHGRPLQAAAMHQHLIVLALPLLIACSPYRRIKHCFVLQVVYSEVVYSEVSDTNLMDVGICGNFNPRVQLVPDWKFRGYSCRFLFQCMGDPHMTRNLITISNYKLLWFLISNLLCI